MMFTIILLLGLQWSLQSEASPFPMWALCTQDFKAPKKMGNKNVLVQVWGVDKKCAWVYTGPKVLVEGTQPPLHCIPEKQCRPLFKVGK